SGPSKEEPAAKNKRLVPSAPAARLKPIAGTNPGLPLGCCPVAPPTTKANKSSNGGYTDQPFIRDDASDIVNSSSTPLVWIGCWRRVKCLITLVKRGEPKPARLKRLSANHYRA